MTWASGIARVLGVSAAVEIVRIVRARWPANVSIAALYHEFSVNTGEIVLRSLALLHKF
jgi:hypothetical protein